MRPVFAIVVVGATIVAVVSIERFATSPAADSRPMSVAHAVEAFNAMAATHPIGKHQPPLSVDEVLAGIDRWCQSAGVDMPGDNASELLQISASGMFPADTQLRKLYYWTSGNKYHMDVWWINLSLTHTDGRPYFIPIRRSLLRKYAEEPPSTVAWGPRAENGLEAACYLVPARGVYAFGSFVASRVALRNSGHDTIEFAMPSLDQDLRCSARDVHGERLSVEHLPRDRAAPYVSIRLAPEESQVLYHAPPLHVGGDNESAEACTIVSCQPGKTCRLQWQIEAKVEGAGKVTLRTGEIEFGVNEPSGGSAPAVRNPLEPLPCDELIGELVSAVKDATEPHVMVAGFRTVRGSTSAFTIALPFPGTTEREQSLTALVRDAISANTAGDLPIIRIRTDEEGKPDPETWESVPRTPTR